MPYRIDPALNRAYLNARYAKQRAFFLMLLGDRCCKCHARRRLEIDHIDPALKKIELGQLQSKRRMVEAVRELVEKCQLLCERCHRAKTSRERRMAEPYFRHGAIYGWMKKKCRCLECEAAKRVWHDARNEKRRGK